MNLKVWIKKSVDSLELTNDQNINRLNVKFLFFTHKYTNKGKMNIEL